MVAHTGYSDDYLTYIANSQTYYNGTVLFAFNNEELREQYTTRQQYDSYTKQYFTLCDDAFHAPRWAQPIIRVCVNGGTEQMGAPSVSVNNFTGVTNGLFCGKDYIVKPNMLDFRGGYGGGYKGMGYHVPGAANIYFNNQPWKNMQVQVTGAGRVMAKVVSPGFLLEGWYNTITLSAGTHNLRIPAGAYVKVEALNDNGITLTSFTFNRADLTTAGLGELQCALNDVICEASFAETGCAVSINGALTGTYSKRLNGEVQEGVLKGNTTLNCSYGSTLTLKIPYREDNPYNGWKIGSGAVQTMPSPVNGYYLIEYKVPAQSLSSITLTSPVNFFKPYNKQTITILISGDGVVDFSGYIKEGDVWKVVRQATANMASTEIVHDVNDLDVDEGEWGFEVRPRAKEGQELIGLYNVVEMDNGNGISYENLLTTSLWNSVAGTARISFEDYMDYGPGDYIIMAEFSHDPTAEDLTQNITTVGQRKSTIVLRGDDFLDDIEVEGTSQKVKLPERAEDWEEDWMIITLADGESFRAYRDGVDVTADFTVNDDGTNYYNFDNSAQGRAASNWFILFTSNASVTSQSSSASKRWNISRTLGGGSVTCGWTDGSQVIEGVNTTIDLSAETDKVTLFIAPEDGKTLTVYRDNQDVTSLFTCNSGTDEGTPYVNYTLEVPAQDIATAQWNISFASEGGDVNGDGKVNVSDIDKLIEKINE